MLILAPLRVLLLGCLMLGAGGCAMFQKPADPTVSAPLTPEQQQWWEANKQRAQYVKDKGWYVEGVSGFFDENGRPIKGNLQATSLAVEEEDEPGFTALSPTKAYKRFKVLIGRGPNEPVARAAFQEGEMFFRQQQYAQAAPKYAVAYDRWPDSPLEEDALFKAGESYFFSDQYPKADDAYALLVKKYPATRYLDNLVARRFAVAHYWQQYYAAHPQWPVTPNLFDKTRPLFDTCGHALHIYEKIRLDDPTGPLADDSIMASANMYFAQGRFDDADYHYKLIRTEYPKSEHQYQAYLLGLRAKLMKYQGPDYEGAPLVEAEELAQQLLTQFPKELGEEREKVVQIKAEVRAEKAQRQFQTAEYYFKSKYYGASRLYYQDIVKNYPDTKLAEQSRARIDQVKGEPDVPTSPVSWLVDLLPESKKTGPSLSARPTDTKQRCED